MNDIYHRRFILEFDVWDPVKDKTYAELDSLMFDLKNKLLLEHAGNVKITPISEERIKRDINLLALSPTDHLPND